MKKQPKSSATTLTEGQIKKGGVNPRPTNQRPSITPKPQKPPKK